MQRSLHTKIGIIGGGQLGRMMLESASPLNIQSIILENDPTAPAARLAAEHIVAPLHDEDAISQLAEMTDVLTYEIENVGIPTLLALEAQGFEIIPSASILNIIADKGLQKEFYTQNGLPTAPYFLAANAAEVLEKLKLENWQGIALKSRREGYDGKGVQLFRQDEFQEIANTYLKGPFVAEKLLPGTHEIAVMVARDRGHNVKTWPVVEMIFDPVANLVDFLVCPARVSEAIAQKAAEIAVAVVEAFNGIGVFAIEMFLHEGEIFINETAPRVHNSGHHTIEACHTGQFEQLMRILCGLPMGDTSLKKPAAMLNILGGESFTGEYSLAGIDHLLTMPETFIHLYGKRESRPMRKLGHITILAGSPQLALEKAMIAKPFARTIAYEKE